MKSVQIVNMPPDGHCFFHTFLWNLSQQKKHHYDPMSLRHLVARYLEEKRKTPVFENDPTMTWENLVLLSENEDIIRQASKIRKRLQGGELEALVLAKMFGVSIQIRILRQRSDGLCKEVSPIIIYNPKDTKYVFRFVQWPEKVHYDAEYVS